MIVDNVAASLAFLMYLVALILLFRKQVYSGVVFTPLYVANVYMLVVMAPAFFLAAAYGLSKDILPVIIFMVAFFSVFLGYYIIPGVSFISRSVGNESADKLNAVRASYQVSIFVLIGVLVVFGLIFFEGIPLTVKAAASALSANSDLYTRELQLSRLANTKGAYFGGEYRGQGIFTTLQRAGWSFVVAFSVVGFVRKKSAHTRFLLVASTLLAWVFVAGTGARAPYLIVLFSGVVAYSFLRPIPLKSVAMIFVFMILAVFLLSTYSHKLDVVREEGGIRVAIQHLLERLLLGNGENDIHAIELARDGALNNGLGYYHVRNFISAIPGLSSGMPLAYHLTELVGGGATTFRSNNYISTVYVDFGLFGVASVFILVGVSLRTMYTNVTNIVSKGGPGAIAAASVIVTSVFSLMSGGFHAILADLVVAFGVFGAFYFVAYLIRGFSSPRKRSLS